MKLIFAHNLSPQLIPALQNLYPDSTSVKAAGFERASDDRIWDFARTNGFAIVSKDSNFHQRSLLEGPPPKVIWIQRGNCSTLDIEGLLRARRVEIEAFGAHPEAAFLELE